MSLLLENNILDRFAQPNVVVGIVLLVIGVLVAIFAKKITKFIRKADKVEPNDRIMLTLKAFALLVILISLIVIIIE